MPPAKGARASAWPPAKKLSMPTRAVFASRAASAVAPRLSFGCPSSAKWLSRTRPFPSWAFRNPPPRINPAGRTLTNLGGRILHPTLNLVKHFGFDLAVAPRRNPEFRQLRATHLFVEPTIDRVVKTVRRCPGGRVLWARQVFKLLIHDRLDLIAARL